MTHLSLDFYGAVQEDEHDDILINKIDEEIFILPGHLPPQELFLNAVCYEHPDACSLLVESFPQIRVLRLPDQSAQCRDLGLFADNPNLTYLSLRASFEGVSNLKITRGGRHHLQRGPLTIDIHYIELNRARVYLFVIPTEQLFGLIDISTRRINALNTYLQLLRAMALNGLDGSEDPFDLWTPLPFIW
ncbi:hypothetical protein BDV93DRAFT_516945 [Ceratobasidium sp. AG-I]|nr:hypothetical protein BDV93DRAFT_516945 [Ceratobasidium sp. AG-I]